MQVPHKVSSSQNLLVEVSAAPSLGFMYGEVLAAGSLPRHPGPMCH